MLPIARQIDIAMQFFPELDADGWCKCPGEHLHSTHNGKRDCRVFFEEGRMPHVHCFHASCAAVLDEVMHNYYSAMGKEEKGHSRGNTYAAPPAVRHIPADREPAPTLDTALAEQVAARCPVDVDDALLRRLSPMGIPEDPSAWPRFFLDNLYNPGERLLVFRTNMSQGDYLRIAHRTWLELGRTPSQPDTPHGALRRRNPDGMLFLTAPVTGQWTPNPNQNGKAGRRHGSCCTRYPYAVLESDVLPPSVWLRILVQLHDPIAAIYTSGGKSIHALVKVDCCTQAEFNARRDELRRRLVPLGADPAAITAVRLSRLPGGIRAGKISPANDGLQRLLYLHPCPPAKPIMNF